MATISPDRILLRRGDDKTLAINMITSSSPTDLIGYKARFQLGEVIKTWNDLTSKKLVLTLTKEDTLKLEKGKDSGFIKIIAPSGKCKTLDNEYLFFILDQEVENE